MIMRNIIILAVCLLLAIFCGLSFGIPVIIMLFFAAFGAVSFVTIVVKGIRGLVKDMNKTSNQDNVEPEKTAPKEESAGWFLPPE